MHLVLAGSSGLIGSALVDHLVAGGHQVRRLVRRPARCSREISWDPDAGRLDASALVGADAVINLGGAGLGDRRWSDQYRRTILTSRTTPTALLSETIANLENGPRVLLQGSAVGYYGDRDDEILTEASARGSGFLADVVTSWEAATAPASEAGIRVALLRTGIVMSRSGGSFGRLLPLLRLGLGGPLGPGKNYWPWITLHDHVRAVEHLLSAPVSGPVNLTAPSPARQEDIVRSIARELRRPAIARVPFPALRLVLGEFARDVLASQRALPAVLSAHGFDFEQPTLSHAAAWVTARPRSPR